MVEHSTADREVPSSNLGAPLIEHFCIKFWSISKLEDDKMSALPGNRTRVTRMGILHDTTTPAVLPVWPLQAPYFLHCEKMDLPTTNLLAFQVGGIAQW